MNSCKLLWLLYILSFACTQAVLCETMANNQLSNQSFGFSLVSKRNQTGHWITNLSMYKSAPQLPNNWKVDFTTSVNKIDGLEIFKLQATVAVPPTRPDGYEYFPGVGYYKLYPELTSNFNEALNKCSKDGAHLVIINSEAEYRVLQNIFSRYPKAGASAFVGFHDQIKEGEYITIFGQPLNSTGFLKWGPGDPNNYGGNQNCGCLIQDSFLCDVGCEERLAFFCEYDLSWVEV